MADPPSFFDSPDSRFRGFGRDDEFEDVDEAMGIAQGHGLFSDEEPEVEVTSSGRNSKPAKTSPRGTTTPAAAAQQSQASANSAPPASYLVTHPQKWTEEEVLMWWQRRTKKRKDILTPSKGTDGRNIMRWTVARFEQMCSGNTQFATALYQDLRNEIERFEQFRRSGAPPPEPGRLLVDEPRGTPRAASQTRRQRSKETQDQAPGDGRRGSGSTNGSIRLAPCASKVQAKAGSFQFNPAHRVDQPKAPKNGVTKQPSLLSATMPAKGSTDRNKSAPRTSSKLAGGASGISAQLSQHSSADPGGARARNSATSSKQTTLAQKRPGRSLVMEDLGDETLVQMGTPTKKAFDELDDASFSDARRQNLSPPEARRCARAASLDDDAQPRQRGSKGEDEDLETRRMFDKRELRRRHKAIFEGQLNVWRENKLHERPNSSSEANSRVRVCVRKRPLFSYEWDADEFDVISVRGKSEVVVHNCLTKADLRSLFISHMGFQFTHTFGEDCHDDEVYACCAAPAVSHMNNGGVATLFMFGQTGSGKTHTMAGLIKRAADQLFSLEGSDPDDEDMSALTLTAFEIAGKNMRDLLDTSGSPKELKVMEDREHRTQVLGVKSTEVVSAEHLLELVTGAQAQRATRATQVNDTSSRSHAVYRMRRSGGTVLTLVDCAGSERREDSTHHDHQTRKDAAEINSTIFALKECFRVLRSNKGQQPPYRDSLLTRVLSDSFASEKAMIVAIGTVSPSATDTEHSIGTLRALQQLQGTSMAFEEREDVVKPKLWEPHPRVWSAEEVKTWLEGAVGGLAKPHVAALTRGTDGKNLVRWPIQRFTQFCSGDEDLANRLYQDLRQRIRAAGGGGT